MLKLILFFSIFYFFFIFFLKYKNIHFYSLFFYALTFYYFSLQDHFHNYPNSSFHQIFPKFLHLKYPLYKHDNVLNMHLHYAIKRMIVHIHFFPVYILEFQITIQIEIYCRFYIFENFNNLS